MKTGNVILLMISIVTVLLNIVMLCYIYPRELGFDYLGLIVGILAFLTAILLGWQIFSLFNINRIKDDVEKIRKNTAMTMESGLAEFHSSMALYISSQNNYLNDKHLLSRYIMNRLYAIIHIYNTGDYYRCEVQITTMMQLLKQQVKSSIPKEYKEVLMPLITNVVGLRDISNRHQILEILNMFDT